MKLGESVGDVAFCTEGIDVGTWSAETGFRRRGRLPVDRDPTNLPFSLTTWGPTRRLLDLLAGTITTSNVWHVRGETLLATADGDVFRSVDGGYSWRGVHELPPTSGPMGVLPTSVCVTDDAVYLAEYPLGDDSARVLVSHDEGVTWATFHERDDVRHFHGVYADPYTDTLWGTTGDADGQCIVGQFTEDGEFEAVGRGGQEWRAVEPAFTESSILWGVDSAYVDGVDLFRLPRERVGEANPTADRVGVTDAPVFYAKTLTGTDDEWVVCSTAAEAGVDSTAPPSMRRNTASRTARVLAASAASEFEEWYELFAFDRRRTLGEVHPALPTVGAYVFLSVADDGLLVNPYNTARRHGEMVEVPTATFDDLPETADVHRPTTLAR